jgi:hypothetical protein
MEEGDIISVSIDVGTENIVEIIGALESDNGNFLTLSGEKYKDIRNINFESLTGKDPTNLFEFGGRVLINETKIITIFPLMEAGLVLNQGEDGK